MINLQSTIYLKSIILINHNQISDKLFVYLSYISKLCITPKESLMRIVPIGFQPYKLQKSVGTNKKTNIQKNTDVSFIGKRYVAYPRRYLPEYQSLVTNKTFDSFTKLRDKNYLLSVVAEKMKNAREQGTPFSIALFDMDNFKSVNELLGYKIGDDFIMETSKEISSVAQEHSIHAYRFGGEEFVLVFRDNQTPEEKAEITDKIIYNISSNLFIKSKSKEYLASAYKRLDEFNALSSKVNNLIPLKAKRDLLHDLQFNFETKEARKDIYLQQCIREVNFEIKQLYLELINSRICEEKSAEVVKKLKYVRNKICADVLIDEAEEKALDEYLLFIYDKTFEIYQIKKWISDFNHNNGFSMTGCIANFDSESIEEKIPIDIINEAGESLKQGKATRKGQMYFRH